MKARPWLLVIVMGFVLTGGALVAWFFWRPSKFDFDKLGGTILVYELDPEPDQEGRWEPGEQLTAIMAESLQRRLDPNGYGEATVLPIGKDRVEIRVPRVNDDHEASVMGIKVVVLKTGRLELRMLANGKDDLEAINDAAKAFENANGNAQIEAAAERGLPPPALTDDNGKPRRYQIATRGAPSFVTYSWVELGTQERKALNLDNAAENDPKRNVTWHEAKDRRNRASQLRQAAGGDEKVLHGALFYSRACTNRNLPEKDRREKAVEYFVQARDPEFESAESQTRTPKIDGSYLINAYSDIGPDSRPTVAFTLNAAGGDVFAALTRKNVSDPVGPDGVGVRRHLAIILDGLVMSTPTINSEIRTRGQINGDFTQREVDSLVNILRAGTLPATLKPQPVSEKVVAPIPGR